MTSQITDSAEKKLAGDERSKQAKRLLKWAVILTTALVNVSTTLVNVVELARL